MPPGIARAIAAIGVSISHLQRPKWGRMQNGGYLHSGNQDRPVSSRPPYGRSGTQLARSAFGATRPLGSGMRRQRHCRYRHRGLSHRIVC